MRKTTRDLDLASLEKGVSKAKTTEGKIHRKAILEAVYEQMKDPFLERMRVALIDALKRKDMMKFKEIERRIKEYAHSRHFIENQIKARARISKKEADLFIRKEVIPYGE
jgi:hypothetical protein